MKRFIKISTNFLGIYNEIYNKRRSMKKKYNLNVKENENKYQQMIIIEI